MKKFKEFVNDLEKVYVPTEPIHFKHVGGDDEAYVPDAPIHFKYVTPVKVLKKIIKEDEHSNEWLEHNDNNEGHSDLSDKLIEKRGPLTKKEHRSIGNYTAESGPTNEHLIEHGMKHLPPHIKENIEGLDSATKKPIGHEVHLYSGINFNPAELMKKNGTIKSPAYMSFTHAKHVAGFFGRNGHILHVHMKPEDKGVHIEDKSANSGEYETILPRNTTLKVHPKPDIHDGKQYGKLHVWHATVHKQN